MADKMRSVSEEEMETSYTVPTVVVNRYLVSTLPTNPGRVRIAFGESAGADRISYRLAVQMTAYEANELKEILETLLVPFHAEIEALKKEISGGGSTED